LPRRDGPAYSSIVKHVVWDWNGTLIADFEATVESVNEVMVAFGCPRISAGDYSRHYQRPVRGFYEQIMDRRVDDGTWGEIDALFHREYHRRVPEISLAADATDALARVASAGRTQSLLSMWFHDRLVHEVDRRGIARWFSRVEGNHAEVGEPKTLALTRHLAALRLDGDEVLVVGDAIDDVEAASAVGARAVLVATTHHPERLARAGVPVVERLVDALDHL
jgi:phosphoglycolate phosphatase-like HAD superfamily hydrolase